MLMPLVWMSRLLGYRRVERVYGPDLMLAICARSSERGYRHFFYGGAPGVAEKLAVRLEAQFPGVNIVGHHSPPFRPLTPEEDGLVAASINAAGAHGIWVAPSAFQAG